MLLTIDFENKLVEEIKAFDVSKDAEVVELFFIIPNGKYGY